MNGNNNPYPHEQIDNAITKDTLLSLVTGGKWKTSADIPPLSTDAQQTLLEMIAPVPKFGAMAKAATLIPAGSDKAIDMLNAYTKYRRGLKSKKELAQKNVKVWTDNDNLLYPRYKKMAERNLKRNQEQLNKLAEDSMVHQSVNQAMKQYNMFGAARPGTEQFIQKLLKSLNRCSFPQ